ncbi:MAG: hypothetical protein IIT89_00685 [Aeriscardovia sp.]|nr:hypothetical protein [Aeriscardovia sp.]
MAVVGDSLTTPLYDKTLCVLDVFTVETLPFFDGNVAMATVLRKDTPSREAGREHGTSTADNPAASGNAAERRCRRPPYPA